MKPRWTAKSVRYEPAEMPDWVLPQDGIRRRMRLIAENRAVNGWSTVAIGVAADLGQYPAQFYHSLIYRNGYMGIGPQIRLSRVLRMIESGMLVPRKVRPEGGSGRDRVEAHLLSEPPPPRVRTEMTIGVSRTGPKLRVKRSRDYSFDELLTARVPTNGRTRAT